MMGCFACFGGEHIFGGCGYLKDDVGVLKGDA